MLITLMQLTLTALAGILVFVLWRRFIAPYPLGWIVTTSFLLRAAAGQLLFWVSYLELPIGRSLQMGGGVWFFARDAKLLYLPPAFSAAGGGVGAILELSRTLPSITFIQVLSFFSLCFGSVASVAILLNLFAFLGSCAIVLRWSNESRTTVAIALVAISLSPAAILWSLQPLKDTLFQFLIVVFVAAAALWQRAWQNGWRAVPVVAGLLMMLTLFALSGIRWYYAFATLTAGFLFLVFVGLSATGRRAIALACSVVLFAGLCAAFLRGGGPYIPNHIHHLFKPSTAVQAIPLIGRQLVSQLEKTRQGFEHVGGSTAIGAPKSAPRPRAAQPRQGSAAPAVKPERSASRTPESPAKPVVAPDAVVPAKPVATTAPTSVAPAKPVAAPASVAPAKPVATTAPAFVAPAKPAARSDVRNPKTGVTTPKPVDGTTKPADRTNGGIVTEPAVIPTPVPPSTSVVPTTTAPALPAPMKQGEPAPVPAPSTGEVQPAVDHVTVSEPTSRQQRFVAGMAAIFLPRFVSQPFGLVNIQGGRGLLWFADFDTIFFDAALIAAAVVLFRRMNRSLLRSPLFWLVVLMTVLVAAPLAYVVANFGTLFRLRAMVFVGITLLPLAMSNTTATRIEVSRNPEESPSSRPLR